MKQYYTIFQQKPDHKLVEKRDDIWRPIDWVKYIHIVEPTRQKQIKNVQPYINRYIKNIWRHKKVPLYPKSHKEMSEVQREADGNSGWWSIKYAQRGINALRKELRKSIYTPEQKATKFCIVKVKPINKWEDEYEFCD